MFTFPVMDIFLVYINCITYKTVKIAIIIHNYIKVIFLMINQADVFFSSFT